MTIKRPDVAAELDRLGIGAVVLDSSGAAWQATGGSVTGGGLDWYRVSESAPGKSSSALAAASPGAFRILVQGGLIS